MIFKKVIFTLLLIFHSSLGPSVWAMNVKCVAHPEKIYLGHAENVPDFKGLQDYVSEMCLKDNPNKNCNVFCKPEYASGTTGFVDCKIALKGNTFTGTGDDVVMAQNAANHECAKTYRTEECVLAPNTGCSAN